jgi:Mce-associated membrane protein
MPPTRSSRPAAESQDPAVPKTNEADTESPAPDLGPSAGDSGGAGGRSPGQPGWRRALPAVFGAVTVVLGALGAWAAVAAHDLRTTAASANLALVDPGATGAVTSQVTRAVETIFSYSYADTGRTRAAAQGLLTGPAISQYDQLFALVERDAPTEKLVLTTRVTNIGVELLSGGQARLLVFADQQDTVAGTAKSSYGGAMFAVTAVLQGRIWKIEDIDTFTGSS